MFDPEAHLNSLAPIGWTMGLERIEALSDELGRPQDRFDSIHVVGTNGKSSTARMIAAIAGAHGVRAGCTLSPHLERWSERVMIGKGEIDPEDFAAAVGRTAAAAGRVESGLPEGGFITQFELATAAAFLALAEAGVELAAVEAGLGGRLDATNTIDSRATVLTSIGLDHTEFLGGTELEIAAEKLAVLRPRTNLVLGKVSPEVDQLAERTAGQRDCRVVRADPAGIRVGPKGRFQLQNFALARAATEIVLGELDPRRVVEAAAGVEIPGRLEEVAQEPLVLVDAAHNRPGAAALAASLPEIAGDRPVVALFGALSDKDAPGMLEELAPVLRHLVATELPAAALAAWGRPGAGPWSSIELCRLAVETGVEAEAESDPAHALDRARKRAIELDGIVLVVGSHFLIATAGDA